ncbi:protein ALP1-like isoform X4 [Triticum urartu]|uniref:protein ALP1-like isoform X4 n=1 Tax=Triticum urartu TaxID=4572 RepID=UPI00204358C0|nr:protein ALP1-like isoform X4 [Triticum urartu]
MYSDNYFVKLPRRVSGYSGLDWVQETLARDTQCYNMFRVERPLFNRLHNTLVQSYGLKSTSKMTSVEALAMFLWIVGSPKSVRQAENRFRRSMETVSRTFNRVLTCLLKLAHDIIVPKDPTFSEVHPNLENPAFWPHFNDCIGAIDGTHVNVVVDKSKRIPYLNRHNETSQNVLAVCDFDMRFTFVMSGWPGSAHDMRVFKDAITTHHQKFPHPLPGKYYVIDAGYPNRPGYLSSYRCTRYHVEQWQNGPPPQEDKQSRIIVACMALHNFIRESRIADREFDACDADENYNPMPSSSASAWPEDEPLVKDIDMNDFRDELAHTLFHGV